MCGLRSPRSARIVALLYSYYSNSGIHGAVLPWLEFSNFNVVDMFLINILLGK